MLGALARLLDTLRICRFAKKMRRFSNCAKKHHFSEPPLPISERCDPTLGNERRFDTPTIHDLDMQVLEVEATRSLMPSSCQQNAEKRL